MDLKLKLSSVENYIFVAVGILAAVAAAINDTEVGIGSKLIMAAFGSGKRKSLAEIIHQEKW